MAETGDDAPAGERTLSEDPREAELSPGLREHVHAALFGGDGPSDLGPDGIPPEIGRFRITRRLGAGGMGEVLAGFDDELERPVAVKLLHRDIGEVHRDRLRREAKALAQLSHPNVVQVYEVGSWREQLFIAMELVEGQTLRQWLAGQSRSVDEVLRIFLAAGAGLAAAHGRDLIHRDFKPDNVIVGNDGRPRILDFGLARKDTDEPVPAPDLGELDEEMALDDTYLPSGSGKLGDSLTQTGTVLGTPAYMPPEQLFGQTTTAASDQFSFCVALWEAVYGERPFAGRSIRELAVAVSEGQLQRPESPRGPAALRSAITRGLAVEGGERWPTMQALLEELESIRSAPARRRRVALALASLGVAGAAAVWAATRPEVERVVEAEDERCAASGERFAGIWDEDNQRTLAAKYEAAGLSARQWWPSERRLLDSWAADWSRIHEAACASDERERAPLLFEQRMTCLDQRWNEIKIRVAILEQVDPDARAAAASGDYLPFYLPHECENEKLVASTVAYPSDPDERREVLETYFDLRIAQAWSQAAFFGDTSLDLMEGLAMFSRASERVTATGFAPTMAEQAVLEGNGNLVGANDEAAAFRRIEEASRMAQDARVELLYVLAELWRLEQQDRRANPRFSRPETLEDFARWESALQRVGSPATGVLELQDLRAQYYGATGRPDEAKAEIERSLALATEAYGPDTAFMVRILGDAAHAAARAGLSEDEARLNQELIETTERIFGPDAAQLRQPLSVASDAALQDHRLDDAHGLAMRVLKIARAHHGDAGTAPFAAKVGVAWVDFARGDAAALAAGLDELWDAEVLVNLFHSMAAEITAADAAARGEVDPRAAKRLSATPSTSAVTTQMTALTLPLVDGRPVAEALRAVEEAAEAIEVTAPRLTAALVRGHLHERAGNYEAAAQAFAEVATCGCSGGLLNGMVYAAMVGHVRTLRKAGDPTAEPAAANARELLSTALPTHPLLAEL